MTKIIQIISRPFSQIRSADINLNNFGHESLRMDQDLPYSYKDNLAPNTLLKTSVTGEKEMVYAGLT